MAIANKRKTRSKVSITQDELTKYKEATAAFEESKQQLAKLQASLDKLQKQRKNTEVQVIYTEKKKKVNQKDLNADLVLKVKQIAKTYVFRTVKFIENDDRKMLATKKVFAKLPKKMLNGMQEEEFLAKYSDIVYKAIKDACQEVQSNGKKKAQGMYFVFVLYKCDKCFAYCIRNIFSNLFDFWIILHKTFGDHSKLYQRWRILRNF